MEAKFADLEFARRAYTSVVRRVLDNGVSLTLVTGVSAHTQLFRPPHVATTELST